jgi:hypothetical protein
MCLGPSLAWALDCHIRCLPPRAGPARLPGRALGGAGHQVRQRTRLAPARPQWSGGWHPPLPHGKLPSGWLTGLAPVLPCQGGSGGMAEEHLPVVGAKDSSTCGSPSPRCGGRRQLEELLPAAGEGERPSAEAPPPWCADERDEREDGSPSVTDNGE